MLINNSYIYSQLSVVPQIHLSLIDDSKWINSYYQGSGFNLKSAVKSTVSFGFSAKLNYKIRSNVFEVGVGYKLLNLKGEAFLQKKYMSYAPNFTNLYDDSYLIEQRLDYIALPISYSYAIKFDKNDSFSLRPKVSFSNLFLLKSVMNHRLNNFAIDFRSVDYYTYQLYASAGVEFWFKRFFFGLFYSAAITDLNRNFKGLKLAQIKLTMGYEISFKKKEKTKK